MKYFFYLICLTALFTMQGCERDDDSSVADEMPVFPGGQEAMSHFILENINYPADAREHSISGTVIIEFIIDKTGLLKDIHTKTNLGYGLEDEVIRVFTLMGEQFQWTPGKKNGKPIDVRLELPVKFVL